MITSSINVASTVPGMYAIDKWGRRPLLFWGAVGMAVSQFLCVIQLLFSRADANLNSSRVAMLGTLTTGQNEKGDILVYNVDAQKAGIAFICIYICRLNPFCCHTRRLALNT
jgi:MFS transporter, SP family, sugar:H+ symporter